MFELINSETLILISIVGMFVAGLFGLIAVLSLMRRRRYFRVQSVIIPQINTRLMTLPPPLQPAALPVVPSTYVVLSEKPPAAMPIPEHLRHPVLGATDPVTLMIEPDSEPTRDLVNVKKLIEFLKRESA
jgi:hypothetical protein